MNSSTLAKLASSVSLASEIAKPTELKNSVADILETADSVVNDFRQFEPPAAQPAPHEPPAPHTPSHSPVIDDPEEEYDAEKSARALVHTLHGFDQFILNIAVLVKCMKRAGGNKNLAKMKEAITREFSGEELSTTDQHLIAKFKEYKANMNLLSGEMIMKPEELAAMIEVATDYCEQTRIKIGPGTALLTNYLASIGTRITKLMMS